MAEVRRIFFRPRRRYAPDGDYRCPLRRTPKPTVLLQRLEVPVRVEKFMAMPFQFAAVIAELGLLREGEQEAQGILNNFAL